MQRICIFDLDGTLVDSMARYGHAMTSILREENVSYGAETVKIITPLGYRGTAEYYVRELGVRDSVENLVRRMERALFTEYSQNIRLKPGVEALLRSLRASGARLFVLTASPHLVTDACLKANGVFDLFEKVWSVDDFGLTKSDTSLFYEVARVIGCSVRDVQYFDDNVIAVTNAACAGYRVYGVRDIQPADEWESVAARADVPIESFEDFEEDSMMNELKIPTQEEIARVKGLGFLRDKTTPDCFNARVPMGNGRVSAEQMEVIAAASRLFGSGKVALTSRMTFEIQGVPYANIEPLCDYLAKYGLETGGTGPRVRPVVSCKGTTCHFGLIDTFALSEKIHERFYKGYHEVKLPHKFKIGVGGCPNNCVKPDLNDLGVIGQMVPVIDLEKCRGCKTCAVAEKCPMKACRVEAGKVVLDGALCNSCGRCRATCPFGAFGEYVNGYRLYVGGRWGKKCARGVPLSHLFTSEEEVLATVEKTILFFRAYGLAGERLADTVSRVGLETVEKLLLSDELSDCREEILNAPIGFRSAT